MISDCRVFKSLSREKPQVKVFSDFLVLLYLWIYVCLDPALLSVTSQGLPRHTETLIVQF